MDGNHTWIGIDYGSKLAGTTVICYLKDDQLQTTQVEKKKDADQFIIEFCRSNNVKEIFIDAPLSLPAAYYGKGKDYFYREADKMLKAMSPMFLGGLTARAIKLKDTLKKDITFHEVYPGALIRQNEFLNLYYNKKTNPSKDLINSLKQIIYYPFKIDNLHQFDAIIAWYIGYKKQLNESTTAGNLEEGLIIF